MIRREFLCGVLIALMAPAARADTPAVNQILLDAADKSRQRTVPLRVYLPESKKALPVILFSHGLGGSRDNNPYLGNHWAAAGYVCVFMQHAGSDREVFFQTGATLRERVQALKDAASLRTFQDRMADVPFVIDQLEEWNKEEGHPLRGKLDLGRIGMSGHSYGAVTTLAVSGRRYPLNRNFHEPRIDAFVALSPQPGKGMSPGRAFGQVSSPVLCMTGTKDDSPIDNSVTPEKRREVFKGLPKGDKYELVFEGGHHFTFSDVRAFRTRGRDGDHHPAIQKITLQFWDAYLKQDSKAKSWLQSEQVRPDCKLKQADVWQWK